MCRSMGSLHGIMGDLLNENGNIPSSITISMDFYHTFRAGFCPCFDIVRRWQRCSKVPTVGGYLIQAALFASSHLHALITL